MMNLLDARSSLHTSMLKTATQTLFPILRKLRSSLPESIWLTGSSLRSVLLDSAIPDGSDLDLIFFNAREVSKSYEKDIELALIEKTGLKNISVKNQARIATVIDGKRYDDIFKSVESFPDVTVAAAVQIFSWKYEILSFFVPYGLAALQEKTIRPTSAFLSSHLMRDFYLWAGRKEYVNRLHHWRIEATPRIPSANTKLYLCRYSGL